MDFTSHRADRNEAEVNQDVGLCTPNRHQTALYCQIDRQVKLLTIESKCVNFYGFSSTLLSGGNDFNPLIISLH